MNPTHNLEEILRGFRPRPPSPRLRASLFAPPIPEPRHRPPPVGAWLAPLAATAFVVLVLATASSPSGLPAGPAIAQAAWDRAWEAETIGVERNAPRPGFHSTSTGAVTSHFGFLLLRQTNTLVR